MQPEQVETVSEEQDGKKGYRELHDAHRGDVVIVSHGPGYLGSAQGVVYEVGFAAAYCGIDILPVHRCVGQKVLLSLIDDRDCKQKNHGDTQVCYQPIRKFQKFVFWAQEGLENDPEPRGDVLTKFQPKRRYLDPVSTHFHGFFV